MQPPADGSEQGWFVAGETASIERGFWARVVVDAEAGGGTADPPGVCGGDGDDLALVGPPEVLTVT